jgi:hypothetical protein
MPDAIALVLAAALAIQGTPPPKVSAQPVLNEPGEARMLAAGTQLDLLLQTPLDAGSLKVDDRFEAIAISSVAERGTELTLAQATARGFVGSVRASGGARSTLTLAFETLVADGKAQRLRGAVVQIFEPRKSAEGARLGAAGGPPRERVPLAGVLLDGAGTITATDGRNVRLPAGTILRIRLDQPVQVRVSR